MTSCSQISSELAELSAQIAALDNKFILKSEKQGIIQASAAAAKTLIMPGILSLILSQLAPVKAAIAVIEIKLAAAAAAAASASAVAVKAASAIPLILAKLAVLAGLATTVAAVAAAVYSLLARIQALEIGVGSLTQQMDKAYNLISLVNSKAANALSTAQKAAYKAGDAINKATEAVAVAGEALLTGQQADNKAGTAINKSDAAAAVAGNALNTAQQADNKAGTAINKSDAAAAVAGNALNTAQQADSKAGTAINKSDAAAAVAGNALNTAQQADSKAVVAGNIAQQAQAQAAEAAAIAQAADSKAVAAGVLGASNAKDIGIIYGLLNGAKVPVNQVLAIANQAIATANQALVKVNDLTQQLQDDMLDLTGINGKLDNLATAVAFVPAKVDALVVPKVAAKAAEGLCATTNPGGCMHKLVNKVGDSIKDNTTEKANFIINLINKLGIKELLERMKQLQGVVGPQLLNRFNQPVGVSTWLQQFTKNQVLDRALAVLTFATTVHNATQLSSQLATTLGTALGNVLQFLGIKDQEGKAYQVNSLIGKTVQGIIQSIVGAENYNQLSKSWAAANRIYQAGANVLNTFQSTANTILDGLQITLGRVGKIGNALRNAGQVLEDAYTWMNPNPRINRITTNLEKLNDGASTVEQITQAPIEATQAISELQQANTAFLKALKEDDKPANQAAQEPEPNKFKKDKEVESQNSQGVDVILKDFDPIS
ncbi:hypothetical protein [Nodularia spumigena]|uniref:hypothetical protein n=1 Tax=Nodularia spumigena TaxID=70799 RepID=UPI002330D950|nr:hypothetical protein [Nodularia spumigena]MDB9349029.1 hypothetical protein [Nodularia spumigena CS-588/01]